MWYLAILVGGYLILVAVLALNQRAMIYHPEHASQAVLEAAAGRAGFQTWQNQQGEPIGWKRPGRSGGDEGRVLILHGNAGYALDRVFYADVLQSLGAFDVHLLEYPGYGSRAGSPSQTTLFQAADEALQLLSTQSGGGKIWLVGESLGTGVASYLAGAHPDKVSGVLLVAPFNNLAAVARHHLPLFPTSCLLRDRFDSERHLQGYPGPVGFLLAGRDRVVPGRFGERLHDGYRGRKKLWLEPESGHEDLLLQPAEWWRDALDFLRADPEAGLESPP